MAFRMYSIFETQDAFCTDGASPFRLASLPQLSSHTWLVATAGQPGLTT